MNAATLAGSFRRGLLSTPLATSTPFGAAAATAAATFSGVSPPASRNGRRACVAINDHGAGTPPPPSRHVRVVQPERGRPARRAFERSLVPHAQDADQPPIETAEVRGGLVAGELRLVQLQLVDAALDLVDRRVDEHADLEHARRNGGQHVTRGLRLDEALRPRPQVHAESRPRPRRPPRPRLRPSSRASILTNSRATAVTARLPTRQSELDRQPVSRRRRG